MFFALASLDYNPPIYASHIAGMTCMHHLPQLMG
jgi:hypothetical protein